MKNFMRFLCAAMLLVSFAACDEKENENDNPGNGDNNSTLAAQLVGTWQSEHIYINDEEVQMQLTIVMNADGTGELAEMSEVISWQVSGNNVNVTNSHGNTFTFTVTDITETYMIITGNTVPGTGQQAKFEGKFLKVNGGTPDTPDPGDLGLSAIDPVDRTETSLTVNATITGDINQYLPQFPNFACGFIWSAEGAPTMNSNSITGTPDAWGKFEVTITGLESGKDYTIIAWLKLTPESEPILSSSIVMSTLGGSNPISGWVDLGLPSGLLWASCNVGATSPEQYGNYYAWGETQPKSEYYWDTYIYCTVNNNQLATITKYNPSTQYGGPVDNLTILQASDDAATANLGNGARTPTMEEWEELNNNTTKESAIVNGVEGFRFTATNGNSIFLPFAGMMFGPDLDYPVGPAGYYWTASLYTEYPCYANSFMIEPPNGHSVWYFKRSNGFTVRAVKNTTNK